MEREQATAVIDQIMPDAAGSPPARKVVGGRWLDELPQPGRDSGSPGGGRSARWTRRPPLRNPLLAGISGPGCADELVRWARSL
jgi:hypothetical protein